MRSIVSIVAFGLTLAFSVAPLQAADNTLTTEEVRDGWILLFDGKTLFGWEPTSQADWQVVDGTIRVTSGDKGLLCTTTQFSEYILKVDFRAGKETNSGIFLHTSRSPQDPASDCYELNIVRGGASEWPTGSLVGRKKAQAPADNDGWQTFEIILERGHFVAKLDGQRVMHYHDDDHSVLRGFIGLQLNQGEVEFRNIKLKPLKTKSIFNGKDLEGWKDDHARKSEFNVTDEGTLHLKNGPGQLETVGHYGDFLLQLEVFVNGEGLNSGIFFRSIPDDFQNGYEAQISNAVQPGTDQPKDCGTGGIFRRQNARRVVSKDFEWTAMTLVADGPHMACWVNGIQVSDWTDTRPANENPRRGLRLEPGSIILQGHDPTTDLSFRNFRILELPTAE